MKTYSSWNGAIAACNEVAEIEWWWQCHEVYATPDVDFFFVMGHVSDKESQERLGNALISSRQIEDDGDGNGVWGKWIFSARSQ